MYFWKTKILAENIKTDNLKQSDFKNYLIAGNIIIFVSFYGILLEYTENLYALLFEMAGTILMTVFGMNIIFRTNGGDEGEEYLNRYISISFPLYLKFILLGVALGVVLEVMREYSVPDVYIDWLYSTSLLFFYFVFFWRINVHIRCINA